MYDSSLDALCTQRPQSLEELRSVPGFGERKIETYGEQILAAIAEFDRGGRALPVSDSMTAPLAETLRLIAQGESLERIAALRQRQLSTVVGTVAVLVERGDVEFDEGWVSAERRSAIEAACAQLGTRWLKPLKEALPAEVTSEDIRLVVARLRRLEFTKKEPATA